MNIENEKKYSEVVYKMLEYYPIFEEALEDCDEHDEVCEQVKDFLVDCLDDDDDDFDNLKELRDNIDHIEFPKKKIRLEKKSLFPDKLTAFLYSSIVSFCKTDKVKGIPLSKKCIENLPGIRDEGYVIHYSYITGETIGFAHSYCNRKLRENYYKIPVIAHNLFKLDFFFLLKDLWSGVWKTQHIYVGRKNPSDIYFVSIGNQIQFIDTIKYFQRSLGALANSLTDKEKTIIFTECEKFLRNDPKLSKQFLFCNREGKKGFLIICCQEREQY